MLNVTLIHALVVHAEKKVTFYIINALNLCSALKKTVTELTVWTTSQEEGAYE